jgi:hypothetical protein
MAKAHKWIAESLIADCGKKNAAKQVSRRSNEGADHVNRNRGKARSTFRNPVSAIRNQRGGPQQTSMSVMRRKSARSCVAWLARLLRYLSTAAL